MNVNEAINEFLIASEADGLSRATVRWYAALLKRYGKAHGDKAIKRVKPTDVRLYINQLRRSDYKEDTIHAHIRALHRFWHWAAIEYQIPDPMRNIKYPRQPKPQGVKAASYEDAARLLEVTSGDDLKSKRDRAIVALLIATGARAGGIVGLRPSDVDLQRRRAVVLEKGKKRRTVFFDPDTRKDLEAWLEARNSAVEWLFYNLRTERQLTVSGLLQIMLKLGAKAGIEGRVNPHAWRHAFGVSARKSAMDSINLSNLLGHEDVQTTAEYYTRFGDDDELARIYDLFAPRPKIKRS